ncbi:ABC transporter permease [Streptomyces sp. TRM S81-3]|uniref:ABC transporter permease n=1 Tax=Streptomyces griseicoloratus TaxID=2752516 RepID=A0A926L0M7_9ACTN|nr:ABC transporter permease [Streptomyces griseicoloratus]MBD0420208.1 ABC transporter permease [Streptomyces griseicoloratus]
MASEKTWHLSRRLFAVGRTAGRRAEAGGVRFVALLLATLVLSVGLASVVAVHAVYAGKEERRIARTPAVSDGPAESTGNSTRWLVGSDSLAGERRFSVVYLAPHKGTAPLPPGVDHWPAPGQVVLSPALREAGASEDIDHRYGQLAGTIKASGLDEPTEWLAYVRPRDGLAARESDVIAGFGPSAGGWLAPGLEPGTGRQDDKPEWMFQAAVLGMLVLPALALMFVAARTGAHARDRRTALVAALGGRRRDRALVAIGEAAQPALLGALLGAAAVTAPLLYDLHVPYTNYIISSGYLRQYGSWAGLIPLVALLAVLAAVVLADLAQRQAATATRPHSAARTAWLSRLAALCPLMILLGVRGPDFAGPDSAARTLISWAGIAGTVLTLPAAVATVTAAAGRVLTGWGQRHSLAGTLVAGRRTNAHPGATARLVTGITVALILLMQAVAWQGLFGSQSAEAQHTLDRVGRSIITVGARGAVPTSDMKTFLDRLPDTEAVLLLPPADPTDANSPMKLHGDCDALANLHLPCPSTTTRISEAPQDPRLQELIRWTPHGALLLDVHRTNTHDLAKHAASSAGQSFLAVLSRNGETLSIPAVKQLASEVFPRGAQVRTPGEGQLTAGIPNRDQGRWSALFGVIGIAVLALTASLSAMAEFLRHGRALAPLSVLTGGLRVFRTSSAWSVLTPLAVAGLAGSIIAAGLAAPITGNGVSYIPRELAWSAAGIVLLISVLMWLWAATVAVRQARAWRPRGD